MHKPMTTPKTAILLINLGTPDDPSVNAVRRFLSPFLNDMRVIDLPWLLQKILVNIIIVPFRAPKSAKLYQKLWTSEGFPLRFHGVRLQEKLQAALGSEETVFLAMRYGNPGIPAVLKKIEQGGFSQLTIVPLFPHYASSSTGTAIEKTLGYIKKWNVFPEIRIINQFYNNPGYIDAFVKRILSFHPENYEHVIFSYHGLPLRHTNRVHTGVDSKNCTCTQKMPAHGEFCYKATCYETTRLLVKALNLHPNSYTVSFQSRLSKKWLQPFTDHLLIEKAQAGLKKILIVSPAFVADCLETTVELGIDFNTLFQEHGGEHLQLVDSLNDMPEWVDALKAIVDERL